MIYEVKCPILGFTNTQQVNLESHDGLTTLLTCSKQNELQLTLINTSKDKEYFEIPLAIQALLDINKDTNYSVYFTVIINKIIPKSIINLGAPIIFNEDNKTVAQCVISNDTITLEEIESMDSPSFKYDFKNALKVSNLIKE